MIEKEMIEKEMIEEEMIEKEMIKKETIKKEEMIKENHSRLQKHPNQESGACAATTDANSGQRRDEKGCRSADRKGRRQKQEHRTNRDGQAANKGKGNVAGTANGVCPQVVGQEDGIGLGGEVREGDQRGWSENVAREGGQSRAVVMKKGTRTEFMPQVWALSRKTASTTTLRGEKTQRQSTEQRAGAGATYQP